MEQNTDLSTSNQQTTSIIQENLETIPSITSTNPVKTTSSGNPHMAGFLDRFLAVLIDGVILLIPSVLLGIVVLIPLGVLEGLSTGGFDNEGGSGSFSTTNSLSSLLGLVLSFVYHGYFYTSNSGRTLGQKLMNIKPVTQFNLGKLNWTDTFLREVIGKWLSGTFLMLGYLWYFMSTKRQTWHDIIAKTYMVKTDEKGDVLMGGPEVYPKEPVKTFGCCAGCLVLVILLLVTMGAAIFTALNPGEQIRKARELQEQTSPQQEQMEEQKQEDFDELQRQVQEEFDQQRDEFNQNLPQVPEESL